MDGKKVVVVGAGQQPGGALGNGRAICRLLAQEGAEICAVDLVLARAEDTAAEIAREGGTAHVVAADVTEPDDCGRLIDEAHRALGRIDVLVNVVGHNSGDADALELDPPAWQKLFDANLRSMWLTSKTVVPIMQEQRTGVIVNISSVASRMAGGSLFAYSLSKAGVEALTRSFAARVRALGYSVQRRGLGSYRYAPLRRGPPLAGSSRRAESRRGGGAGRTTGPTGLRRHRLGHRPCGALPLVR